MKIVIHNKHITQAYFFLYCIQWHNLEKTGVIDLQQVNAQSSLLSYRHKQEKLILFSCSTQLSIKFKLLIKTKTLKKVGISCF